MLVLANSEAVGLGTGVQLCKHSTQNCVDFASFLSNIAKLGSTIRAGCHIEIPSLCVAIKGIFQFKIHHVVTFEDQGAEDLSLCVNPV